MEIRRQAYRETYITLRPLRKSWAFFLLVSTALAAGKVLIANLIRLFQATGYVRVGSLAALFVNSSSTAAFQTKRTFQVDQFCENLGDIPECPLFSKAAVQIGRNWVKLGSAFGHKPPVRRNVISPPSRMDLSLYLDGISSATHVSFVAKEMILKCVWRPRLARPDGPTCTLVALLRRRFRLHRSPATKSFLIAAPRTVVE